MLRKILIVIAIIIVTLLVYDYVRVRVKLSEIPDNTVTASRCVAFAAAQVEEVSLCEKTLRTCHTTLEDDSARARLVLATKLQTVDLIRRSVQGDEQAKAELSDVGWTRDMDKAGRRITSRYDELRAIGAAPGPGESIGGP